MTEVLAFNAKDYPSEEEAFDAYRRLYSNGADVSRLGGAFHVVMQAWRYQKLILFDRHLEGVVHARVERVASDDFDHFTLTYVVEGRITITSEARTHVLGKGEGMLLDMQRACTNTVENARILTVACSRELLGAAAGSTVRLHGHLLDAGSTNLLGDYLQSLASHNEHMAERSHGAVVRAFVDLLSIALHAGPAQGDADRRALAKVEAAEIYIAREAYRKDIKAEDVAAAINMSRASLYRLLAPLGGVGRLIALRRLKVIRQRLEAGDETSIANLAQQAGFKTEREARNTFETFEAIDPDAYRQEETDNPITAAERNRRRWAAWMNEV